MTVIFDFSLSIFAKAARTIFCPYDIIVHKHNKLEKVEIKEIENKTTAWFNAEWNKF